LKPLANARRGVVAVVETSGRLVGLTSPGPLETSLRVVDVDSGEPLGPAVELDTSSQNAALSPDGSRLAIATAQEGTEGDVVTIYDVSTGREQVVLDMSRPGSVRDMTFSPDGQVLLAAVEGTSADWWDTTTGAEIFDAPPIVGDGAEITRLAMSPSSTVVALGRQNGRVELWSNAGGDRWEQVEVDGRHMDRVTWIDFDDEGNRLVSTSADGQAMIWDAATGTVVDGPLRFDAASALTYFRPGSTTELVTIDSTGSAWEWDLGQSGLIETVSGIDTGASVASATGTRVFVSNESSVTVHDPAGGDPVQIPSEPGSRPVRGVAASADGSRFVVTRDDGGVELRDTASGALVVAFDIPIAPVDGRIAMAIDSDGSRVAYQAGPAGVVVADADGSSQRIELAPWRQRLQAIELDPSGDQLVISTSQGEAIWYEVDGVDASAIAGPDDGYGAQFLADGRIATGGRDGVHLIDPRDPEAVERLAFAGDVRRVAVDPTGRLLATVDKSGAVQLWDVKDGTSIGDPLPLTHESPPVSIRFSADGHYLVVGGAHQVSWISVETADWTRTACTLAGNRRPEEEVAQVLSAAEGSVCA
jgi:WD40 repeat protein